MMGFPDFPQPKPGGYCPGGQFGREFTPQLAEGCLRVGSGLAKGCLKVDSELAWLA
jgi:hypothetical protein